MSGAEKHTSLLNQWADALEELPSGPFASEDIRAAAAALTTAEARIQELEAALTMAALELDEAADKFWVIHCNHPGIRCGRGQEEDKQFLRQMCERMNLARSAARHTQRRGK